jgi:N6-L-threonylcarbamoyladenine synthase
MKILAIETSCDETAAAVVQDGTKVISSSVASSKAMHEKYGGVVPEVAAREQLRCMIPTIDEALSKTSLDHIDAIAVTVGPGLIGSLLVGVETAKTLSFITGKPLIPVNHVLAHMYANFVNAEQVNDNNKSTIEFPAISLVVSGGHTELYLMTSEKDVQWLGGTLDDAAGECFDKTARLLGFGHGGGVAIQKAAKAYTPIKNSLRLPRPMLDKDNLYNFSFSGLKTAILREVQKLKNENQLDNPHITHLSYEIQESITDVLVKKTMNAARTHNVKSILLSGGVAANLRLREKFQSIIQKENIPISFRVPPVELCTDNAVYIASYAFFRGKPTDWHETVATPDLSVEE